MRLWEVIRELENNPKKKFKSYLGSTLGFNRFGILKWFPDESNEQDFIIGKTEDWDNTGTKWQEVKQPVTWQEAIQAFMTGKIIRCETNIYSPRTYKRINDCCNHLIDNTNTAISAYELLEGEWYIED